jgi:cytochrome c peroxidase
MPTKPASTAVVASFALLAASVAAVVGRVTPVYGDLRGAANSQLGAVSAPTAGEADAPLARLGRALFWAARLSANGQVSCASCHT